MRKGRQRLYLLLCAVLLVTIGVAGWNVAAILLEYRAGEQVYLQMAELSLPGLEQDAPEQTASAAEELTPARDFSALQEVNPDVVAWISIPGTRIDYPVVQGEDNRFYLKRLVTGAWNASGSIFLDFRAAADFSDPYSIVYGHNMLNGSMFSDLMSYKTQAFFDGHPSGVLETPEGVYEIAFFSGFVASGDNAVWDTDMAGNDFAAWAERMAEQSWFRADGLPAEGDRILALSTCSYEYDNARFVLLGILREA